MRKALMIGVLALVFSIPSRESLPLMERPREPTR